MEQDKAKGIVYQRNSAGAFDAAVYQRERAKIPLVAIEAELELDEIYRSIIETA